MRSLALTCETSAWSTEEESAMFTDDHKPAVDQKSSWTAGQSANDVMSEGAI